MVLCMAVAAFSAIIQTSVFLAWKTKYINYLNNKNTPFLFNLILADKRGVFVFTYFLFLLQILIKEVFNFIERNGVFAAAVIQVGVNCAGDD